jgi:hypothetical protein
VTDVEICFSISGVGDAGDLYGLPLERFVPERSALAKALRAGGNREEAARVAALRKPSVAAWTVNQLVRTQRQGTAELFEAGDAVQRAQSELLAGAGDARALRAVAARERDAVEALVALARGLLGADGHEPTAATLERVGETLHAAALDLEARALVREGRLERELRRAGFGEGELVAGAVAGGPAQRRPAVRERAGRGKAARGPSDGDPAERDQAERDQAERDQAEREREEREREREERERAERRRAARSAEAAARRAAERAAREVSVARERRDRAAATLREADEALAAAAQDAEAAAREHEQARAALGEI